MFEQFLVTFATSYISSVISSYLFAKDYHDQPSLKAFRELLNADFKYLVARGFLTADMRGIQAGLKTVGEHIEAAGAQAEEANRLEKKVSKYEAKLKLCKGESEYANKLREQIDSDKIQMGMLSDSVGLHVHSAYSGFIDELNNFETIVVYQISACHDHHFVEKLIFVVQALLAQARMVHECQRTLFGEHLNVLLSKNSSVYKSLIECAKSLKKHLLNIQQHRLSTVAKLDKFSNRVVHFKLRWTGDVIAEILVDGHWAIKSTRRSFSIKAPGSILTINPLNPHNIRGLPSDVKRFADGVVQDLCNAEFNSAVKELKGRVKDKVFNKKKGRLLCGINESLRSFKEYVKFLQEYSGAEEVTEWEAGVDDESGAEAEDGWANQEESCSSAVQLGDESGAEADGWGDEEERIESLVTATEDFPDASGAAEADGWGDEEETSSTAAVIQQTIQTQSEIAKAAQLQMIQAKAQKDFEELNALLYNMKPSAEQQATGFASAAGAETVDDGGWGDETSASTVQPASHRQESVFGSLAGSLYGAQRYVSQTWNWLTSTPEHNTGLDGSGGYEGSTSHTVQPAATSWAEANAEWEGESSSSAVQPAAIEATDYYSGESVAEEVAASTGHYNQQYSNVHAPYPLPFFNHNDGHGVDPRFEHLQTASFRPPTEDFPVESEAAANAEWEGESSSSAVQPATEDFPVESEAAANAEWEGEGSSSTVQPAAIEATDYYSGESVAEEVAASTGHYNQQYSNVHASYPIPFFNHNDGYGVDPRFGHLQIGSFRPL